MFLKRLIESFRPPRLGPPRDLDEEARRLDQRYGRGSLAVSGRHVVTSEQLADERVELIRFCWRNILKPRST